MKSMTGYGKGEYKENGINLTVELKTVNNRFLDLMPKYPRSFIAFDDIIRKTVQAKVKRGRVELFITYSNTDTAAANLKVDTGLAKAYVEASKKLESFGLENDFTVVSLMRSPDVITEETAEEESEKLEGILVSVLNKALDNLNSMRLTEGEKLKKDMLSRMNVIEEDVGAIKTRAPQIAENYRLKLIERLNAILGEVKYDEGRMLQEVTLYADKSNIDEEITRLSSHISQFRAITDETEDVGKKLDFLVQEFNRESNTICSKSNDITLTKTALALKNEIEKVREQIQNIE